MPDKSRKKILIAEDEKPMAKALNHKLTRAGFTVTLAGNGEEALKILEKEEFDLIISDLIMPRVDGFGLLNEIKARGIKTPVIIASNLSQVEDAKRAKRMGARDYFIKSNTPIIQIVEHVKKVLKII